MSKSDSSVDPVSSRRSFLKAGAAAAATATAISSLGNLGCASSSTKAAPEAAPTLFVSGSDRIRVGLVGCGGRGTGAAQDCCLPNDGVELVALGDVFPDRVNGARDALTKVLGPKMKATSDECFTGFDAYKKVIASEVDLVILATPPGFRPIHLAAAVDAGKHVFAEKPVAVDAPGIRSILESTKKIDAKGLAFVCGTQRRHDPRYQDIMRRIHDGAIGEIVSGNVWWNQGGLWKHDRQPEWTDMEWQIRNWLYFTWLSGDHIVEQHVHNLDVFNWAMNDHPASAYGMGGRQVRTSPIYGHIFDHFAIEYAYPNGVRMSSQCRQIDGCDHRIDEFVAGTKGTFNASGFVFKNHKGETMYQNKAGKPTTTPEHPVLIGPYQQEHIDLVNSIRSGKPLNEAKRIAESTMTAIMGRMSAYTGKLVTWEQAMNSQMSLMPGDVKLGPIAVPAVAVPGKDQLT